MKTPYRLVTKTAPLVAYCCQAFRDLTELENRRADGLQNYIVQNASKSMLSARSVYYTDKLLEITKEIERYMANPVEDTTKPTDLTADLYSLQQEIQSDDMIILSSENTNVRDIVNFHWLKGAFLDKISTILMYCELHKCSSLIVVLQSTTAMVLFIFNYILMCFNDCEDRNTDQFAKHEPIHLNSEEWFKDVMERFGGRLEVDRDPATMVRFIHNDKQTVFTNEEQAAIRQRELEQKQKSKEERELQDRKDLARTYGQEINTVVNDLLSEGKIKAGLPEGNERLLLFPETLEQCELIEDFTTFLRAYASHVRRDKEYAGDRVAMFKDAIEHILVTVVDQGIPSYMNMINMVTPKVVIHSLNMFGKDLEASIAATMDVLSDPNATYNYDFRSGTSIKICRRDPVA